MFIPVIISTETDHRLELLGRRAAIAYRAKPAREIIEDLGTLPPLESKIDALKTVAEDAKQSSGPARPFYVCCLPARADRDELAGAMLMQLLQRQGIPAHSAPGKLAVNELVDLVEKVGPDAACISVVSPSTVIQARHLCVKLKARFPQLKIVVGLWGTTQGVTDATKRLRNSGANEVVTTLNDAVIQLAQNMPTRAEQMIPATIEERAAAHDLQHDVLHA